MIYLSFLLFQASSVTAASSTWNRTVTPQEEVYSDASPRVARQVLERIRQLRGVFQEFGRTSAGPRVKVLVFASEREFSLFRPVPISSGFYQSGPDGQWIGLLADGDSARIAAHEYVHLLLNRGRTTLPQWLEEGLAEFYSTLEVAGDQIRLGEPPANRLRMIRDSGLLSARELVAVGKNSPHLTSDLDAAARFYGTSWALVHMLNLDPDFAQGMLAFVTAIDEKSVSPEEAFRASFGQSIEQALALLPNYLNRPALPRATVRFEGLQKSAPLNFEPVEPIRMLSLQAEMLSDAGNQKEAARYFGRAIQADPNSPLA